MQNIILKLQKNQRFEELIFLFNSTDIIDNWKFIFFREKKGVNFPENLLMEFGKISTVGVNGMTKFSYLDKKQAQNFNLNPDSDFAYVPCINFDTQVVSYMIDLFKNKNTKGNHDLYVFLRTILEKKLDYTCIPYCIENCAKLDNHYTMSGVLSSLRVFFFYKSMKNVEEYDEFFSSEGELDISLEVEKEARDFIHNSIKPMGNILKADENHFSQKTIYALLLHTVYIKFSSNVSLKKKVELLFDFWVNTLGMFMQREMAICYLYLANDKRVENFFGRIQKNNKNYLSTVFSMAWDLTHIRNLEEAMGNSEYSKADFEFHMLATYDRGLKEVLSVYPIASISFNKQDSIYQKKAPIYEESIEKLIKDIDVSSYIKKRSPEKRAVIFEKTNFNYLIREQEKILNELFQS